MLLSDRDIRTQIDSGRVALDPYEPDMIQPSSIDARSASTRSVHRVADQPPVLHGGAFPLDSHCAETMTPCSSVEAATELVSDRLATKSRGPDDH